MLRKLCKMIRKLFIDSKEHEYIFSFEPTDNIWSSETYNTPEEAIDAARTCASLEESGCYVGERRKTIPRISLSHAKQIIYSAQDIMAEHAINEEAEGWKCYLGTRHEEKELRKFRKRIDEAYTKYLKNTGHYAEFYKVRSIKQYIDCFE